MKISLGLSVALAIVSPSVCVAAVLDLQQAEQQLIAKYKSDLPHGNSNVLEKNIVYQLLKHADAFDYPFTALQNSIGPNILWSPDHKLKFYVFDIGQGEQMREVSAYIQYRYAGQVLLNAIPAGEIYDVTQIWVAHQPVYLLQSYYKGRACSGVYEISAFRLAHGRVQAAQIFFGKIKKLDKIQIAHDCTQWRDQAQDPTDDYVRLSADHRFLDLRLVDTQGVAQSKFQRMVLTKQGYQYQDIIDE